MERRIFTIFTNMIRKCPVGLLLSVALFALFPNAGAAVAAGPASLRDSLERVAVYGTDREKVAAYSELAGMSAPEKAERYIDLMAAVAEETGDEKGKVDAMYKRALIHYVAGSLEKFLESVDRVEPYLLERCDDRYVFVEIFVIKRLIAEGRNETASRAAREFLELAAKTDSRYWEGYAYYGMGLTYKAGGYMDRSASAMKKGFDILSSQGNINYSELVRVAFDLINLLIEKGDFAGGVDYGQAVEMLLRDKEKDGELPLMKMYLYSSLAICYVGLDDTDRARDCLDRAAYHLDPSGGLDNEHYHKAAAVYFRAVGQYDQALKFARKCVEAYSTTGSWLTYYIAARELESEILAQAGDYRAAYDIVQEVRHRKDSLASQQLAIQLSEFYTLYEVERLEAQRQKQSIVIVMTSSLCLLFIVAIVIFIVYSYRLHRKNISLYESIRENLRKEKIQSGIRQFIPSDRVSPNHKLYYRLCRLMEDEELFRDPDLRRLALAQKLGTNERYLADAVKEGAETTITGFISKYRLNYSVSLLSAEPDASLEEIAEKSGFGAYSSFYRAFSKNFGMSPGEYQKYSKRKY